MNARPDISFWAFSVFLFSSLPMRRKREKREQRIRGERQLPAETANDKEQ